MVQNPYFKRWGGEKLSEREERSFGLYTASQFIDELRSEQQESVQANK
jgi:hypothetical protein